MTATLTQASGPRTRRPTSPIAITGIGVVAPSGIGAQAHWESLLGGELSVQPLGDDGGPVALAGRVTGFDVEQHVEPKLRVQTDRWTWMSLAASAMALEDAGYCPADHDPYDTSVFLASGSGGNEFGQREIQALWSRGRKAVGAYQSIAWFYAASSGQVSIRQGLKGPSGVVVSDSAGGVDSIGWARRVVRRGTPAVLAGGTEAGLSPYALVCRQTSGLLSAATEPRHGYKPFDAAANGQVVGEGGAVLLLEDPVTAAARGARVWGTVVGYAATHDAVPPGRPGDPGLALGHRQYARSMELALADAGLTPADVDLVIADGAGVPALDAAEAAAIRQVFGARATPVPVTAPAGWTGHLLAGGSALNVATALLAIRDEIAPAVGNLDTPAAGLDLDLVREPRRIPGLDVVLVGARGYGGFNSSLVVRRES